MISICIPIYNYNADKLVRDLHVQAEKLDIDYEIVLLDDVSDDAYRQISRKLSELPNIVYAENEKNIGLSRMRNRLAEIAKYPYLIFVDSDAVVINPDYLKNYIECCTSGVVCFGGCVYTKERPSKEYILRWKFGKKREEGVGRYYSCFNFLIDAELIRKYPFSEDLKQYGYEDNLFGATLQHAGAKISYVDNPMLHPGLDTAEKYLHKISLSISNLILIEPYLSKIGMAKSVRLLETYNKLKRTHLTGLYRTSFKFLKKMCLSNLRGDNPYLFVLDFYKLGLLCTEKQKNK